jgi:hypothetical protein
MLPFSRTIDRRCRSKSQGRGRVAGLTCPPHELLHSTSRNQAVKLSTLGGGVGHDTASDPGQLALAGRELVVLRLARPPRVFAGAADVGGYRGCRSDHHLMEQLAGLGIRLPRG